MVYKTTQLILLSALFAAGNSVKYERRLPRQAHSKSAQQDQSSAETGFLGGGGVENSKYFHYQHLPEHDKYEFGHRRGNDHHVIERYEKAIPHEGQFKTKVRWADKKGGHGEHYWDYNHAGHGGNSGQNEGDRNGGYSDQVPVYSPLIKSPKTHQKRQSESEKVVTLEDVESTSQSSGSNEKEKEAFVENLEKEIGGVEKFDIQKDIVKQKRSSLDGTKAEQVVTDESQLYFDVKTGKVLDELTGKTYILQPVN